MEEIIVREYSEQYKNDIIGLILDIQQNEFGIQISLEDQPDLNDIPGFYQQGAGNFWVALHYNRVVGTVSLLDIGTNQAALRKMFVKSSHRGSTYNTARIMLTHLLAWAQQQKIREIYLGTTPKFLAAHGSMKKTVSLRYGCGPA
jgi:hypothetical protein